MEPVTVTTTVDRPREELYALLENLRAHERFTDHFLVDWSGDADAIRVRCRTPGPKQWSDVTWIDKDEPARLVERLVAAGGKRELRGVWELEPAGKGRTRVSFTNAFVKAPLGDRLLGALVRSFLRKNNARALERLKTLAEARAAEPVPTR